jgi:putative membrane protein
VKKKHLTTNMDEIKGHVGDKERLAHDRTKLAVQRNLLAIERTFTAWIRTGIGAVAGGIAVAKLVVIPEYPWATQTIGALFTMAGAVIFIVAIWRYYRGRFKLRLIGVKTISKWLIGLLAVVLFLSAVAAFVMLILT